MSLGVWAENGQMDETALIAQAIANGRKASKEAKSEVLSELSELADTVLGQKGQITFVDAMPTKRSRVGTKRANNAEYPYTMIDALGVPRRYKVLENGTKVIKPVQHWDISGIRDNFYGDVDNPDIKDTKAETTLVPMPDTCAVFDPEWIIETFMGRTDKHGNDALKVVFAIIGQ